ncbi:unnamed protein product [Prunus armeniaca]
MITTDAFVDFLEDIVTFLWGQAPKVSGGAIANTPRFSRVSGVASGSAKIGGWGLSMLGCD